MSNAAILSRIRKAFEKMNVFSQVNSLKDDENLFTAGALDSLIMIQFVIGIEDEFGIRLENSDINYEQFLSFKNIASLLKDKYRQK